MVFLHFCSLGWVAFFSYMLLTSASWFGSSDFIFLLSLWPGSRVDGVLSCREELDVEGPRKLQASVSPQKKDILHLSITQLRALKDHGSILCRPSLLPSLSLAQDPLPDSKSSQRSDASCLHGAGCTVLEVAAARQPDGGYEVMGHPRKPLWSMLNSGRTAVLVLCGAAYLPTRTFSAGLKLVWLQQMWASFISCTQLEVWPCTT